MDATDRSGIYLFESFAPDRGGGGLFRLDASGHRSPVTIGWRALDVLSVLVEQQGSLVSRKKIMQAVWPGAAVEESNLTVQIAALRRILDEGRLDGSCLQTIPGRGYRFVPNVSIARKQTCPASLQPKIPVTPPKPGMVHAPRLSIVVLPFSNLGGSHEEDYLADALCEDLTTDLSRLPCAFVIARHSATKYKGQPVDIRRVGEELGVRYAVEGSVRNVANVLRVNVQLLSTETNMHLWAGRFDQDLRDPAQGQEEIVSRLRAALGLQVVNAERARGAQESPDQPDAFDYLLRGWYAWANPPGPEELEQAAEAFAQALKLDPSLVPAMCGLASVLIDQFMIPGGADWGNENALEQTASLLAAAAAVEPENERVLFCQGYLLRAQAHFTEAIALLQRVVEIAPNDFAAYRQLGFCWITSGRAETALPLLEKAIRLDPLSVSNRFVCCWMGLALVLLGRHEEALSWLQRALAGGAMSRPIWRSRCYLYLASAHALLGKVDEARRALVEAHRLWPFATLRAMAPAITGPRGLPGPALIAQFHRMREGATAAGLRDHADEEADYGIAPINTLHQELVGPTPMTVPGARTIRTGEVAELLDRQHPILIDVALETWGWSIPGAIGLQGTGHGTAFSDTLQNRFRAAMRELTGGDLSALIIAFCVNPERFTSYNLALRLVGLGYRNVYWYRGGREAWALNNLPEGELAIHQWNAQHDVLAGSPPPPRPATGTRKRLS